MIATLDISKAVDDQGNTIEPEVQFENPIFRFVAPSYTSYSALHLDAFSAQEPNEVPMRFQTKIRKGTRIDQTVGVANIDLKEPLYRYCRSHYDQGD